MRVESPSRSDIKPDTRQAGRGVCHRGGVPGGGAPGHDLGSEVAGVGAHLPPLCRLGEVEAPNRRHQPASLSGGSRQQFDQRGEVVVRRPAWERHASRHPQHERHRRPCPTRYCWPRRGSRPRSNRSPEEKLRVVLSVLRCEVSTAAAGPGIATAGSWKPRL